MKKVFALLFFIGILNTDHAQKNWMTFTSDLGKFSIAFKGDLKQYFKIHESGGQLYECVFYNDNLKYGIDWLLFSSFSEAEPALLLEHHVDSRVKSYGGTKIFEEDIALDGVIGKYYIIQLNDESEIIEGKSFVNGSILYNVSVRSTKEFYDKEKVSYYLNSFKILK